jgi:hypothetical protein
MYKQDELAILDSAISKLGNDSYLGPWLMSVKAEVERDITSDFIPTASIQESRRQCVSMLESTKKESDKRIEDAKKESERILKEANNSRDAIRNNTRVLLERALNNL